MVLPAEAVAYTLLLLLLEHWHAVLSFARPCLRVLCGSADGPKSVNPSGAYGHALHFRGATFRAADTVPLDIRWGGHLRYKLKIAEEGGIQALLRLARARSTDEELQYKAALTVGSLAANAVKMLPRENGRGGNMEIGFGSSSMMQSKATVAAQRGRERTTDFLESQLDSEGAEK